MHAFYKQIWKRVPAKEKSQVLRWTFPDLLIQLSELLAQLADRLVQLPDLLVQLAVLMVQLLDPLVQLSDLLIQHPNQQPSTE